MSINDARPEDWDRAEGVHRRFRAAVAGSEADLEAFIATHVRCDSALSLVRQALEEKIRRVFERRTRAE